MENWGFEFSFIVERCIFNPHWTALGRLLLGCFECEVGWPHITYEVLGFTLELKVPDYIYSQLFLEEAALTALIPFYCPNKPMTLVSLKDFLGSLSNVFQK